MRNEISGPSIIITECVSGSVSFVAKGFVSLDLSQIVVIFQICLKL